MQRSRIANTNIDVSIIGLGTVKLGRNNAVKYPQAFTIPDDKQALKILNTAADCDINLIDTAPAYGNSEERLGQLLPKTQKNWVLSTKVGEIFDPKTGLSTYNFTPEFIQASIEKSLQQLNREVLDIVLIHSDGQDQKIIQQHGAIDTLNHLKKKGLIRATGMSTKTIEGGKLAAQESDIVMITHNLQHQTELPVIDYSKKNGASVFIKKAFASGHISSQENFVDHSFDCIFSTQGVCSIILGSINPDHIRSNATKAIASYHRNASEISH